jgi:hypothetical protein
VVVVPSPYPLYLLAQHWVEADTAIANGAVYCTHRFSGAEARQQHFRHRSDSALRKKPPTGLGAVSSHGVNPRGKPYRLVAVAGDSVGAPPGG